MSITVKILADSIAPCGKRLTTYLDTYPRFIHSELLTHGALARNSASSRAIPVDKMLARIVDDSVVPVYIGANQKGMQAGEELPDAEREEAVRTWLSARDFAVQHARRLQELGVHKAVVNRLTEPFMWIAVIVSMTEDANFYGLRDHEAAEPHFQDLARKMRAARDASTPRVLAAGEWHLPLIDWDDEIDRALSPSDLVKVSVGRCARVSYLTHDGRRDPKEDIALHDRLITAVPGHMSPAEHAAQAMDFPKWFKDRAGPHTNLAGLIKLAAVFRAARDFDERPTQAELEIETVLGQMRSGRFWGFRQYRKTLAHENIGGPAL